MKTVTVRRCLAAASIWLAFSGCATPAASAYDARLQVTKVSDRPPIVSGVIVTWVRLDGTDPQGHSDKFFIPFLDEKAELPKPHSQCDIKYHTGTVSGMVGTESLKTPIIDGNIVDDVSCK